MLQIGRKSGVRDLLFILIGTGLMAIAIRSIYDPIKLVTGGFSGLGIVVKTTTEQVLPGGMPLWLTNAVLNVPLFLIGIRIKGMKFLKNSIIGTVSLSVWLYILPVFNLVSNDILLAVLFGGALMGVGIGLVFLGQGTTGGTDMAAALIQSRLRHYSIAQIMQIIDGMIVLIGAFVFGLNRALYAVIAIVIATKVTDSIIEGMKFAKAVYIITGSSEETANKIMTQLERGVTGIFAKGMYSNEEKNLLFCVVSKKQLVVLKELVYDINPDAFVIVNDVREVLGEGF